MNELKDAEVTIEFLRMGENIWWTEDSDDGQPLPEKMTNEELRSALLTARADAGQACADLLAAFKVAFDNQQKQLDALSRKVNDHRHALGQGQGWSGKPEF